MKLKEAIEKRYNDILNTCGADLVEQFIKRAEKLKPDSIELAAELMAQCVFLGVIYENGLNRIEYEKAQELVKSLVKNEWAALEASL